MNIPNGKYAWMVKIGEKGQFVIPKEARELFDLQPGNEILVLGDEKGRSDAPDQQGNPAASWRSVARYGTVCVRTLRADSVPGGAVYAGVFLIITAFTHQRPPLTRGLAAE